MITKQLPRIRTLLRKPRVKESLIGAAIGLSLGIIIGVLSWVRLGPIDAISIYTNDLLFKSDREAEQVVIVALDDRAVNLTGNWPIPRGKIADAIEYISQGNPKSIAVDIVFEGSEAGDSDDLKLVNAISAAGNVILGQAAYFEEGDPSSEPQADIMHQPFPLLEAAARESAHINVYNLGSRIPEIPPVIRTDKGNSYMFSLQAAAVAEGKDLNQSVYKPGDSFTLEDWNIPLGPEGGIIVNYRISSDGFLNISLADILNDINIDTDAISPDIFSDKIVLIGPYWQGGKDAFVTPFGEMYGIEIHGNVIESILDRDFVAFAGRGLIFGLLVLTGLFMGICLANLSILKGFVFQIAILTIIIFSWAQLSNDNFLQFITVDSARLFFDLPYPVLTVITCFAGVSGRKYYMERSRRKRISGTFERFVTPQVLKEIMKSDDAELQNPHGKLQEITILFIDIRGYTTISEKLPADEVFDLLNRIFAIGNDIFTKYNGTINKFIGDAIMVIFNAPLAQPDHALNAVKAACEMQEALESFLVESGIEISCGIGINTGMAMVGTVGSGKRMEYTCIGDTVNIASRLEGQAKEGVHIVIGPATYEHVKDHVEALPLAEILLKGKSEVIQPYQVIYPNKL